MKKKTLLALVGGIALISYYAIGESSGEDITARLIDAIDNGDIRIIEELFANTTVDVNKADRWGNTPLVEVIKSEDEDILDKLLDAGADVNRSAMFADGQLSPLSLAIMYRNPSIVSKLLGRGAKVETENIYKAFSHNNKRIIEQVLNVGYDMVNKKDSSGRTPLFYATWAGNEEAVNQLLDAGADVNEENIYNITPLIIAAENNRIDLVRRLIDAGALFPTQEQWDTISLNGKELLLKEYPNAIDSIRVYLEYWLEDHNFLPRDIARIVRGKMLSPEIYETGYRTGKSDVRINDLSDAEIESDNEMDEPEIIYDSMNMLFSDED